MFITYIAVFLVSEIAVCLYWLSVFFTKMPEAKVENAGSVRKWTTITKGSSVIEDFMQFPAFPLRFT